MEGPDVEVGGGDRQQIFRIMCGRGWGDEVVRHAEVVSGRMKQAALESGHLPIAHTEVCASELTNNSPIMEFYP